jgi:hypothetical protein
MLHITVYYVRCSWFYSTSSFRASRSASDKIKLRFIPTRKHFASRQQLHIRRDWYVTEQSPSSWQTKSIFYNKQMYETRTSLEHLKKPTPSLTAFRRKKALHGAHVGTPKLMPTARSSHTRHEIHIGCHITIDFNPIVFLWARCIRWLLPTLMNMIAFLYVHESIYTHTI